ncbi:MAG: serine hydrolase [Sphingomonadales bacterium]
MARVFGFICLLFWSSNAMAQSNKPLSEPEIDKLVEKALVAFDVPGIGVAIIKDNKIVHAKGYGVRDVTNGKLVDKNTLYQIGSNTKSMTSAALAILMDEGKLSWDDLVIDYLPEFRMFNPYVTSEFTIKDMLTHRSGLPLGAGDLLFWPNEAGTIKDVIKAVGIIPPVTSFRSEYAYDNLMYILAGEIVTRVSGMEWADFIEKRMFKPMGMTECYARHRRVPQDANIATPHAMVDGKIKTVEFDNSYLVGAAGGVNCSAKAMTSWISTQLNHGVMPNGERLFSKERHADMWTPVTIRGASLSNNIGSRMNISLYALGWGLSESMGHQIISHSGGLGGMLTSMITVPELDLGILVFANQQNGYARGAISGEILAGYFGKKPERGFNDYVAASNSRTTGAIDAMTALWAERDIDSTPSLPLSAYAQTYSDAWYGDIEISQQGDELYFTSLVSPRLRGKIKHFQYDTFIVEWDERALYADAYLNFKINEMGEIEGIDMKKFDPRTDFSFDFHHLNLKPKSPNIKNDKISE